MATTRPQQVINELQKFLSENIEDPNPDRNGTPKWIYTIPINFDVADYPRIHIQPISAPHNGYSIGSNRREVDSLIQISIFHSVDKSYRLDVDDDNELENANMVVDFLAEKVIDLINDNQDKWQGLGDNIHYFITEEENLVQDQTNSVVQYVVEAELRSRR